MQCISIYALVQKKFKLSKRKNDEHASKQNKTASFTKNHIIISKVGVSSRLATKLPVSDRMSKENLIPSFPRNFVASWNPSWR